jgi:hypothetical protein
MPAWVTPELPPAYRELAERMAGLRAEARAYEDIAQMLWRTGEPLTTAVRELFTALRFDAVLDAHGSGHELVVRLDGQRRLLVAVGGSPDAIDRQSPVIKELLRLLQDEATSDQDRLVLAINAWCELPLEARRGDPITPDALRVVQRLGANVIATTTLFGVWKYSLVDLDTARKSIMRLHGQDGGVFK